MIFVQTFYFVLDISGKGIVDIRKLKFGNSILTNKTRSWLPIITRTNKSRNTAFSFAQFTSSSVLRFRFTIILPNPISRSKVWELFSSQWTILYIVFIYRRYLRETLKMANAEDLNRLTSCSLVLLGHIFLALGNSRESMNMVTPAMQLASKIPDIHVQLWASAILKGNLR